MIYCRGAASDYDDWAYNGATGWGWKEVLPEYKALEDWEGGASELRGAGGPLHVTRPNPALGHEGARAFMEGAKSLGYPETADFNGGTLEGPAWVNFTVYGGKRQSSAVAFLRPGAGSGPKADSPDRSACLASDHRKGTLHRRRISAQWSPDDREGE